MISILVVNHNGGELLARCVETLHDAAHLGSWHEIVIADNASTDGSLEAIEARYPKVRILDLEDNLGFGAANNRAAAVAEGDRLLLLNSDAWPLPGCLQALDEAFDDDPRLGLAAPRLEYPDGTPQFHWAPTTGVIGEALQMLRNRFEPRPWVHRLRLGPGWYSAACILVRREAFDAIDGFDESFFLYFEDVDLSLRLRREGWRTATVDQARAVHVKGGSQGGGRVDALGSLEYRRGQLRYYRKHRPTWEQKLLHRRLRTKFRAIDDPEQRVRYLALLDA